MIQRTLSIIKPDAVKANLSGKIISDIEEHLKPIAMKRLHLSPAQAAAFYAVHEGKAFFNELIEFMSSGPIIVMCLEAQDAIAKYRTLMGATNPEKAEAGTLRKKYAKSIQNNAVHGSDAPETAAVEIAFFFSALELVG
ncbi:MAG: nucleoside-diphosphate kinase [Bradymonadales bacterium]|jgi:nucleoside-diphosphate kinase